MRQHFFCALLRARLHLRILVATFFVIIGAASASHAASITPGAFGLSAVTTTFDGLGLPFGNPTPLLINGNTYTTDNGVLRYITGLGLGGTDVVGSNNGFGYIDIVLGTDAKLVGGYVGLPDTLSHAETVQFFDALNNLLGSVSVSGSAGLLFAGWETTGALIHRVRINDTADNGLITLLDNFTTQVDVNPVPLPAALPLFATVFAAGIFLGWKRKKRQA